MSTTPIAGVATFSADGQAIPDYKLYLRKIKLVIADAEGNGLDLSEFKVTFEVVSAVVETPRHAKIRVYNLSDATMRQIQSEFLQVSLSAGYQNGPFGEIFTGLVTKYSSGKIDAITKFLEIDASDAELSYNFATINTTLAAGTTQADTLNALVSAMPNVQLGKTPSNLSTTKRPRGQVLYGTVRAHMRTLGINTNAQWFIQDGTIHLLGPNDLLPGGTIILNLSSGLIGTPEQTIDGVAARALLNPLLVTGRGVQIDAALVNRTNILVPLQTNDYLPPLSPNNVYKIYHTLHKGDNRGNDWETQIICAVLNPLIQQPITNPSFVVDGL
jgi:hypothetical protein